ncbi:MAG: protein-L-isoaspartate O-methyltransferase [Thermoplasmata archaeon]|nr:protein-L-isoaspartate O-methyltransferase [Thermoplasmata archaeon]
MDKEAMRVERDALVDSLIRRGYIVSSIVEEAMRRVPREEFVPARIKGDAYVDTPMPIGAGQTISAPHMVAIMVEKLDLKQGHRVLEVGSGSGYHAAVVAEAIAPGGHVFTIERIEPLARFAEDNLKRTGYDDVSVFVGDGSKGLREHAPYDRIFVACGAPDIPVPLIDQLADNGLMLVPVGNRMYQDLIRVERKGDSIIRQNYGGCVFVPLIGEFGY